MFEPANLLREARRQKNLPELPVPAVCLLDPDGDIVRHLTSTGRGRLHRGWACYHVEMWTVELHGLEMSRLARPPRAWGRSQAGGVVTVRANPFSGRGAVEG